MWLVSEGGGFNHSSVFNGVSKLYREKYLFNPFFIYFLYGTSSKW